MNPKQKVPVCAGESSGVVKVSCPLLAVEDAGQAAPCSARCESSGVPAPSRRTLTKSSCAADNRTLAAGSERDCLLVSGETKK